MDPKTHLEPTSTVGEVLDAIPASLGVFHALGADTCCGRRLSIEEVARAHGMPVADLLARVSGSAREAPASGGVRSERLAVLQTPPAPATAERPSAESDRATTGRRPSPIYRPFLTAALWCTMTLGASFGAYNLLVIHLALGPVPPAHNWIHGAFQVTGFLLLFIMGISYHVFPRLLGTTLTRPALARGTFWLALGGLLLRGYGYWEPLVPFAAQATALGLGLQAAAVVGWATVLVTSTRSALHGRDLFLGFAVGGTFWWLVAAALLLAGAATSLAAGDGEAAARWNEAIYLAALTGGALFWIQTILSRTGPAFLSLPPARAGHLRGALLLEHAGAAASVIGASFVGHGWSAPLRDIGLLGTGAGIVLFTMGVRVFARPAGPLPIGDPDFPKAVRMAFVSALLFVLLGAGYAFADLLGLQPPRLLLDGARHAFALGFVSLMIFGYAGRIVPNFLATDLRWRRLRAWGIRMIAVAVLLREMQVAAVLLRAPEFLAVSGPSGVLAAAGVCMAGASILGTLGRSARPAPRGLQAVPAIRQIR
jgi:hypothetical protein